MTYKDIIISSSYGKVASRGFLLFNIIFMVIILLCGAFIVAVAVIGMIVSPEEMLAADDSWLFLAMPATAIAISAVPIYFLCYYKRHIKKITLWLEDAVKLYAHTQVVNTLNYLHDPTTAVKYRVKFTYQKEKYVVQSGTEKKAHEFQKCCHKYMDRKVDIMYSPKYNQVMIIRDEIVE